VVIPHRNAFDRWSGRGRVFVAMLLLAMPVVLAAGCGQHALETGFADPGKTQLQFYAPPGATVTVKTCPPRSHQIAPESIFGHRLENTPEERCVFNLAPGRYEFKYTTAEGLPGVSIYGELIVYHANFHEARVFQRRSFIPVMLPSTYYQKIEITRDEVFPYRGEKYTTAIDEDDLQRLMQGDVVEKVFFVADLERAEKLRGRTERDIAVCEREIEYANARWDLAYQDFRMDVDDPVANFWRTDRKFIRWEKKRQELRQELEDLEAKLKRIKDLLAGDRVLARAPRIRRGMLALATEEVVEPHRDVVDAADDLGEVLLVMRIGGRHMQWGDPRRELMAYGQ